MKRCTKLLFLFCCLLAAAFNGVHAQNNDPVQGIVHDQNGRPLAGASVVEKNLPSNAATTDSDGRFVLSLKGTSREILVSYVGYEGTTLKAVPGVLNVALRQSGTNLSDVVVIGYQSQKRRNVTAAVSSIKGGDIKDLPEPSFDQMLQGRLAGVNVLSSSGELGARPNIVIRGATNVD